MATRQLVIAGLGNYSMPLQKHSVGQVLLKNLAQKAKETASASGSATLLLDKKHPAWVTRITVQHPTNLKPPLELIFCLPRQYMNVNGPAVLSVATTYLRPFDSFRIITLQDDLDLAPSVVKFQRGGGPRGHNGVRSVSRSLPPHCNRDFHRVRVGIGRPDNRSEVANWVLSAMGRDEVQAVEYDEDRGKGGIVLERVWEEIMKIGWADEESPARD